MADTCLTEKAAHAKAPPPKPQQPDLLSVLVAGAGPTGLTLACELARRGLRIRVVDIEPAPHAGSRAKGLQPRSLELFDNLGIADRVLEHGWLGIPMNIQMHDGEYNPGGAIPDFLLERSDIPYPASVITPQWRTEEALRLRLKEFGVDVEYATSLVSFQQTPTEVSAVIVKDGVSETVTARWLVGCDGGRSAVRKSAGIGFTGEVREDVRMIIADVRVEGLDRSAWHMWRHPDGFVQICPLPSTDLFQYQAAPPKGEDVTVTLEFLQELLNRRTGRTDLRLHDLGWSTTWRANIRLADRYREGRVFLAGDAAHVHTPHGGQGMNTGIQDGVNLGWKLAAVEKGASPALLDTYEAERRPIGAGVLEFSTARLEKSRERVERQIKRDESTIQLHLNYRDSSLSRDDRAEDARVRAGDRAPDANRLATPGGERRLFELLRGGRFTLLSFGERPDIDPGPFDVRILQVVDRPVHSDQLADREGRLARAYDATDRTLILIRPDGYIGMISDAGDASAVTDYLAALS